MTGGVDNDIYVVDSYGDIVIEAANGGIDEVRKRRGRLQSRQSGQCREP